MGGPIVRGAQGMIAPRDGDGNFASPCLTCSSSLRLAWVGTDLGFQAGGARDKRKKNFKYASI